MPETIEKSLLDLDFAPLVLREKMFGGRFGGLCTQGRHFFNEDGDLLAHRPGVHRSLSAGGER
jgi:hypothetical protein